MASDSNANPSGKEATRVAVPHAAGRRYYHQRIYFGILLFVVVAGLPMVGVPSLRQRLRTRVEILRSAALGVPIPPAPALAAVGENKEPFPHQYEHQQAAMPDLSKLKIEQQAPFRIVLGGQESLPPAGVAPAPAKTKKEKVPVPTPPPPSPDNAGAGQAQATSGTEIAYRKGKSEQEAYNLLVSSNPTLAGMIKGSDPTLRFQDWSAAGQGQDSFYVMVTFMQTSDNGIRKYIWNVKVMTKEIVPLSAYAREISK